MAKAKAFTAAAVLSLAIAIGANTSVFSVINAVLLRPLPFNDPDRLVMVNWTDGQSAIPFWSYPAFRVMRERSAAFEDIAGYCPFNLALTEAGNPEKIDLEFVSASFFRVLGIKPLLGRAFADVEDRTPDTHPVALVSHALWQRKFGADPRLVGRTISVNRVSLTVVGVMPESFRGLSGVADLWTPMMMTPAVMKFPRRLEMTGAFWLQAFARLKPGLTVAQARDQSLPAAALAGETAGARGAKPWGIQLVKMSEANVDPLLRTSLLVLFGAVVFVLLIACANVANLMMARAAAREKEIAIRLALGAARHRLVRQLLTEGLMLAAMGGIGGLLLSLWGIDTLSAFKPGNAITVAGHRMEVPGFHPVRLDIAVLAFNFAVSALTGLLFGLFPAFRFSRPELNDALKQASLARGDSSRGRRGVCPRELLVSVQVALALILLIGAGLAARSFANVRGQRLGFEPDRLLALGVDLPFDYGEDARKAFYSRLAARVQAMPGVECADTASVAPLMEPTDTTTVKTAGNPQAPARDMAVVAGGPALFRTLRMPVRRGRGFTARDRGGAPWVAVLNETAAGRLFGGEDPLGKRISVALFDPSHPAFEVVGVVADVKYGPLESAAAPTVYLSGLQYPSAGMLLIRTRIDPHGVAPAVRRAVAELDPQIPVYDVKTMEARLSDASARFRFSACLLGAFAVVALVLAAIGVYGVMAYSVERRVREIGIRVALGAGKRDIGVLVARDALRLTVFGLAAGLAGSLGLTRLLQGQLFGIDATDPATFAGISCTLAAAALLAACVPARKALRVEPLAAVRYE